MWILDEVIFGNSVLRYLIAATIIGVSLMLGKTLYYLSKTIGRKIVGKTKSRYDDIILDIIEEPIVMLLFTLGIYIAALTLKMSEGMFSFITNAIEIAITIAIAWFILRFVDNLIEHFIVPLTSGTESDLDDHLVPILRKLSKTVVIVLSALIIISNFGYNISSVLAGLGIGGLAFALAAKDMLANLFGGVSILTDKPFKIGDRVRVDEIDGYVREIGLRSTRIETLDGTQMIVPNAKIADSVVENVSAEKARKTKMTLGLTYDTSNKKIEQAVEIVREIIKKNEHTEDDSRVYFTGFGDFSLNVLVIYWIKNLDEILPARHAINMEIKKQFEKAKIDFAFPTQTIEFVKKK